MRQQIEAKLPQLRALCREHHVRRLALFGSALRLGFDPGRSDVDFVVEFLPLPPFAHRDAYFGLLLGLEDLFECPIDLVEWEVVENPYLRRNIEHTQETLYAAA